MISSALAILETEEERNELSEIYTKNGQMFYAIAYSIVHNNEDAEDAVHEAFVAVAKNSEAFFNIPLAKRVAYINIVVKNISCKIWNKKQKIQEHEGGYSYVEIADKKSTENIVMGDYTCKQTINYINTLPEETRIIIHLKMKCNLSNSEIAKFFGISEEAARKRVERASNKIKRYMEELDNE